MFDGGANIIFPSVRAKINYFARIGVLVFVLILICIYLVLSNPGESTVSTDKKKK